MFANITCQCISKVQEMNHGYCYSVRKCTIPLDKSPHCIKELMWHFLVCSCKTPLYCWLSLNGCFNQKTGQELSPSVSDIAKIGPLITVNCSEKIPWVGMDILLLAKVILYCSVGRELGKNRMNFKASRRSIILISGQLLKKSVNSVLNRQRQTSDLEHHNFLPWIWGVLPHAHSEDRHHYWWGCFFRYPHQSYREDCNLAWFLLYVKNLICCWI